MESNGNGHHHARMRIDVTHGEDHAIIVPRGYLNAATGDQIDKEVDRLVARKVRYLIVNFGQVELINTIGISILVGIIEKVASIGGIVYFTELGGTNREVFDVLNLGSVALVFPDDRAALDHMRRDDEMGRAMGDE